MFGLVFFAMCCTFSCPVSAAGKKHDGATILAFVCCLKASGQLVAVVTCTSAQQFAQLQQHPAIALLQKRRAE